MRLRQLYIRSIFLWLILTATVGSLNAAPGNLDQSFDPGPILWQGFAFPAFKYATAIQPDGKILIGGQFNTVAGTTRTNLMVSEESSGNQYRFGMPGPRLSARSASETRRRRRC